MKSFILAALAASVALSPIAAVPALAAPQQHQNDRGGRHVQKKVVVKRVVKRTSVPAYRSWHRGERFDYRQARNYRQIDYRKYRNLKAPPRGYHYVQSGNDAVLVGVTSGIIAAVIAGALH